MNIFIVVAILVLLLDTNNHGKPKDVSRSRTSEGWGRRKLLVCFPAAQTQLFGQ